MPQPNRTTNWKMICSFARKEKSQLNKHFNQPLLHGLLLMKKITTFVSNGKRFARL